jgi:integrase
VRSARLVSLKLVATAEQLSAEFTSAAHITKDTLASLLRRHATKRAEKPAGLDPCTVNYIHTIVHRAYKDAVRWGRLAGNPADASDPPHGGQKSDGIQAWDAATLRSFLDDSRVQGDRLHGLWVLLATSGMRRGEALGLRWRDVDLDASRVRVVQTLIQTRGAAIISEPKTARGRRPISLDKSTVAVLREHRKQMLAERLLVGPDFNDSGFVFHQPDGSRLKPDAVSTTFLRRVESSDRRAHHPPRPPPHLGNAGVGEGHPPTSSPRTSRSLDNRNIPRDLQPRHSHAARPGIRTSRVPDSRPSLRREPPTGGAELQLLRARRESSSR